MKPSTPEDIEPIYPFRWDVTKRSQIGSLIENLEPDQETWLRKEMFRTEWSAWRTIDDEPPIWLKRDLLRCSAKIIGLSDDSDLFFVGRSLDSIFDYLSGLLHGTTWEDRINLLHFSMRWMNQAEVATQFPRAIARFRNYFSHAKLEPSQLARRERPAAFIDIVSTGGTFGNLIELLHSWCVQNGGDWPAVQRKLRIVGLPKREHTSPKTWRWWQHAEWVRLLEPGTIKNVSIPAGLFEYVGAAQSKISISYTPWRRGDPSVTQPNYDLNTRQALRLAVSFFDEGQRKADKFAFARELSKLSAMQHAWFRGLAQELKA